MDEELASRFYDVALFDDHVCDALEYLADDNDSAFWVELVYMKLHEASNPFVWSALNEELVRMAAEAER